MTSLVILSKFLLKFNSEETDINESVRPGSAIHSEERSGMWTGAALIAYISDVHDEVLNYGRSGRGVPW